MSKPLRQFQASYLRLKPPQATCFLRRAARRAAFIAFTRRSASAASTAFLLSSFLSHSVVWKRRLLAVAHSHNPFAHNRLR